jgi:hypothetical protein
LSIATQQLEETENNSRPLFKYERYLNTQAKFFNPDESSARLYYKNFQENHAELADCFSEEEALRLFEEYKDIKEQYLHPKTGKAATLLKTRKDRLAKTESGKMKNPARGY